MKRTVLWPLPVSAFVLVLAVVVQAPGRGDVPPARKAQAPLENGAAAKAPLYYTIEKAKGKIRVTIHNTPVGDHEVTITPRPNAPAIEVTGRGSAVVYQDYCGIQNEVEGHVVLVNMNFRKTVVRSVTWDERKLPLGRPQPRAPARAAADEPPAPVPAKDDPEKEAARKLKLAQLLERDGLADKARARYQEIIDKYPDTKSAGEARRLLEKRKK